MALLFVLYTLASLAHFSHNARYIAFYPGLPATLTAPQVMGAWVGVASVGVLALLARRLGWSRVAAALLVVYGLLGVDGLFHYTLALCSEHTLATNLTIWTEVLLGVTLACAAAVRYFRLSVARSFATDGRAWRSGQS